jgi:hypothetical protein
VRGIESDHECFFAPESTDRFPGVGKRTSEGEADVIDAPSWRVLDRLRFGSVRTEPK